LNVVHSGGIGDIVYSLYVLKKLYEETNKKFTFTMKRRNDYNNSVDNYESLKLLLEIQDYIKEVIPYEKSLNINEWNDIEYDINFDNFRYVNNLMSKHLIQSHLEFLNLSYGDWRTTSWIKFENEIYIEEPYIVINRTYRYRNQNANWINVLQNFVNIKKIFVGMKNEYNDFINTFGNVCEYYPTDNLYKTTSLIRYSKALLCNQSACLTIAQGLNKKVYVEVEPSHTTMVRTYRENEILI
jgi:hypothetical protein